MAILCILEQKRLISFICTFFLQHLRRCCCNMSDWQCEAINRRNQLPGNTRNQLALFYCPRSIPSSPQSYLHIGRLQSRFAIWSRKRCLICQMSNQIHSSATVGWSSVDFKKSGKGLREEGKSQSEGICLSGAPLCLLTGKNPVKC